MTRAKYETFNGVSWVDVTNNSFIPKIKTPVRRKSANKQKEKKHDEKVKELEEAKE